MVTAGDDVEVTYEMLPINLDVPVVHIANESTIAHSSDVVIGPVQQVLHGLLIGEEDLVML